MKLLLIKRVHRAVVAVDRKWEGKTADRMYDLFLFQHMKMLIFSTLLNSMAVFTLMVKQNEIKHKENVLDHKWYLEENAPQRRTRNATFSTVWNLLHSPHYGQVWCTTTDHNEFYVNIT